MKKEWSKDAITYLMSVSFVLVVLLAASWLFNTYRTDRIALMRDATLLFSNTIRSLEDSLIQEHLYIHLRRNTEDSLNAELRADTTQIITIRRESRTVKGRKPPPMRFLRRRMLNRPSDVFAGSLAFLLGGLADTTRMPRMQDTASMTTVRSVIEHQLQKYMDSKDLSYAYHLEVAADTMFTSHLTTKSYVDLSTDKRYALALKKFEWSLLKGMLPEILFSILLLTLVGLAFLLSHRTLEKQRQMAKLKNDLVGNITHELKTPIATVRVALEALQRFDAGSSPEKTKEYLEISQNELKRLEILVENVLKTSITERDELNFSRQRTDVKAFVEGILKTLQLQFDEVRARVDLEVIGRDLFSMVDQTHLTGVIYNLLDNALKYSSGDPMIKVKIFSEDHANVIEVEDQGIGIPTAYQSQVFDKFFRVPNDNKHDVKGHGLGLNYVKRVVEGHGGAITLRNVEDAGTVFQIKLPSIQ